MTALLLTFAAACVDIVGFLTLFHVFTAHMTGVTVHLGQDIVEARWADAVKAGAVIAAFVAGSVVGRTIIEIGARLCQQRIASAALLIEAALIAAVVPLYHAPVLMLLVMLATAMGLQTATLTRVGPLTVHTTFVTGMLNKLAQLLSRGAFLTYDISRGRPQEAQRQLVFRETCFIASIWLLYLLGAVTGSWLQYRWGLRALLLPAGILVIAIALDQVMPLSLQEERDEP